MCTYSCEILDNVLKKIVDGNEWLVGRWVTAEYTVPESKREATEI